MKLRDCDKGLPALFEDDFPFVGAADIDFQRRRARVSLIVDIEADLAVSASSSSDKYGLLRDGWIVSIDLLSTSLSL